MVFKQLAHGAWSCKGEEVSDKAYRCPVEDKTPSSWEGNNPTERRRREDEFQLWTEDNCFKEHYRKHDPSELNEAAADMEENSYSEEHKRRSVMNSWAKDIQNLLLTFYFRLTKRYHKKRVYDTMENQFHEMGLTSVVVACYKDSDGRPVVNWYKITQTHDLQIIK